MRPQSRSKLTLVVALLALYVVFACARNLDERWVRMLSLAGCPSSGRQPMSVFLTVSSLARTSDSGKIINRLLELNWFGDNMQKDDKVALYDHDPTINSKDPLLVISVNEHPQGYYRSKLHFPVVNFTKNNLSSQCLHYWIAYIVKGYLTSFSCLRAQPFWMKTNRNYLAKFRLREIMIPGTHDSGSYERYLGSQSDDITTRYQINQEESVFNQLAYGIRSLDLRIGFYNTTPEKFWINHRFLVTNNTLADVLEDVRNFIISTDEIVILDFHAFPVGFDPDHDIEIHRQLRNLIKSKLKPHMLPYRYGYDVTLNDIWVSKRRIIVAYNSHKTENDPLLWPKVLQVWGDKRSPASLRNYFQEVFSKDNPMVLWASMAEMTPSFAYMTLHPLKGLRGMADDINRNITIWFRDLWWRQANIIASDYFLGNNIINVAINANRRKMMCLNKSLPNVLHLV